MSTKIIHLTSESMETTSSTAKVHTRSLPANTRSLTRKTAEELFLSALSNQSAFKDKATVRTQLKREI
jgi:hypothetical protein